MWVSSLPIGNNSPSERSSSTSVHPPSVDIHRYWHVIESSRRVARIELVVSPVSLEQVILLLLLLLLLQRSGRSSWDVTPQSSVFEDIVHGLPSFCSIDCFLSKGAVVSWYWGFHNFSENAGVDSIEEHIHSFGASCGIACHSHKFFEVGHILVDEVSLHL